MSRNRITAKREGTEESKSFKVYESPPSGPGMKIFRRPSHQSKLSLRLKEQPRNAPEQPTKVSFQKHSKANKESEKASTVKTTFKESIIPKLPAGSDGINFCLIDNFFTHSGRNNQLVGGRGANNCSLNSAQQEGTVCVGGTRKHSWDLDDEELDEFEEVPIQ